MMNLEKNYFFATFSSLRIAFAIINTTKAIIIKLINSPRNDPHLITMGPKLNTASFQAPPGIKGVIIGIITFSTKDFIKAVDATPIINAIARPTTLYSFKNSRNSLIIAIKHIGCRST